MGPKNQKRNILWTKHFDDAFDEKDCSDFLKFIDEKTRLKPLFEISSQQINLEYQIDKNEKNKKFPVTQIQITGKNKTEEITITADKSAHIQIKNSYKGELFIKRNDFKDAKNINEIDKDIIAEGARGFDPFDQEDWPKVIGRQWPTASNTRDQNGVAILSADKSKKAIFLDTYDSITSSYGTKPRAMAIMDNINKSVILAFQQENQNPNIEFAAWSILPFKIEEGKKTLALFPTHRKAIQKFKDKTDASLNEIRNSDQWESDKDKFFVVEVSKPSDKTEYLDSYADWCIFASQDDDKICLARSCYKDKTESIQFKVFSGKETSGGTKYVEIEFIAPKVAQNEKSTLVYRIDFIELKDLNIDALTQESIEENIIKIGELIDQKVNWARAMATLTFSET